METKPDFSKRTAHFYPVKNPYKALIRDLNELIELKVIAYKRLPSGEGFLIMIRLQWPTDITETEFFRRAKELPKAKVHGFLSA